MAVHNMAGVSSRGVGREADAEKIGATTAVEPGTESRSTSTVTVGRDEELVGESLDIEGKEVASIGNAASTKDIASTGDAANTGDICNTREKGRSTRRSFPATPG